MIEHPVKNVLDSNMHTNLHNTWSRDLAALDDAAQPLGLSAQSLVATHTDTPEVQTSVYEKFGRAAFENELGSQRTWIGYEPAQVSLECVYACDRGSCKTCKGDAPAQVSLKKTAAAV